VFSGSHVLLYSQDPAADRAFLRDVLGYPHIDAGDGWLIFRLPPAEVGLHPAMPDSPGGRHELWLMCDDIEATCRALRDRGVELTRPVRDEGFGLTCALRLPSGAPLGFYQPRHPAAHSLPG